MNMLAIQSMAASGASLSPKRPDETGKFGDLLSNQLAIGPSNTNGEEQTDGTKNLLQQLVDILNPPSEEQEALLPLTTADEHSISETEILEDLKDEGLDVSSMAGMIAGLTTLIERLALNDMAKMPPEYIKSSRNNELSNQESRINPLIEKGKISAAGSDALIGQEGLQQHNMLGAYTDGETNTESMFLLLKDLNKSQTITPQSVDTVPNRNLPMDEVSVKNVLGELIHLIDKINSRNDLTKLVKQLNTSTAIQGEGKSSKNPLQLLMDLLKGSKAITQFADHKITSDPQKGLVLELADKLEEFSDKLKGTLQFNMAGKKDSPRLLAGQTSLNIPKNMFALKVDSSNMDSQILKKDMTIDSTTPNNPFLPTTKVEQYVWNMGSNKQTINAEQFTKAFENILNKAHFTSHNGTQKLLIRLNPENLGSLKVELIQKDGVMMAKIMTSTNTAKEIMDSQMHSLKQGLANQNIHVEKIEISQGLGSLPQERNLGREQGQQQQPNQQQHQKQTEENDEFLSQFANAMDQSEVEG
ncbi:flagellar hook-length control protein FliK [Bacillus testis]|uniref:flagellar hook-length control protein FliK n=1 Tax=Bacillus testis TaxID=1622072 RepID=UPI00067F5AB3|nr:flagellar hook-length control protein FliK [Bacillus testis]